MLSKFSKLSRWDKPVGTLLLFIPCQWGLFCSDVNLFKYTTLFAIGSIAMRGAGCTINDLYDIKFDKMVTRTKYRPLASNELSRNAAILWAGAQSLVGLGVLYHLPLQAQLISLSSVPLVLLYPLMKRITHYPQAFLGLAFNYGCLVGYSLSNSIDSVCGLLYLSGWCWTMVYDTLYAHQDKLDDLVIGVKSTAIAFGESKLPLYLLSTVQYMCLLSIHSIQGHYLLYYATCAYLFQNGLIYSTNFNSPESCKKGFQYSTITGILVGLGLLHDHLTKNQVENKINTI